MGGAYFWLQRDHRFKPRSIIVSNEDSPIVSSDAHVVVSNDDFAVSIDGSRHFELRSRLVVSIEDINVISNADFSLRVASSSFITVSL